LLGIVEGEESFAQMDPQVRRRRTQDAVKRILLRESLNQPLMLMFEDLHWIDEETEAFLNLLAEGIANAPVLLLVNYRPEYTHQWGSKTYYTQLRLDPLGKESAEELLSALLSESAELAPLRRIIIEKTEGNPLFMEEIFQALLEDGSLRRNGSVKLVRPVEQLRLPPTVQGILAARIDHLRSEEKELLQTLAVIGAEFQLSLVRQVVHLPPERLDRMLSSLQSAEFVYEQPAAGGVEYTFKHALTHDVAYNSLLTERRKLLHERTARAIEALCADRLEDHLPELANHFDRSDNVPKAVEYLARTGARAAQQMAHAEAIGYFNRALELLRRLPEGAVRDRQELDLQMALNWSSFLAIGLRAPEREHALVRARELCERLGENTRLMEALVELAHFRFNQGDFGGALELGEIVLATAQQANASEMLAGAHFVLGLVMFATGQLPAAREHLERAVKLFGGRPSRELYRFFAHIAANMLAGTLAILGYPLAALGRAHELLAAARKSSDPISIAYTLSGYAMRHIVLRETSMMAERADEMLSLATEHEISFISIVAPFYQGWARAAAGRGEEGIAEMRGTLSDPRVALAASTALQVPVLAETCGNHGRVEEGLDWVGKGLARAEQFGLRVGEAELHRVKGELLTIKDVGKTVEAESCFRTAIDVSRRQGAKLFELRATVSLARLLAKQDRSDEARAMLTAIYGWFTEGFDTADLKEAKALLDELSP
jgi:tetratricopeptide (TPR) repeat protein